MNRYKEQLTQQLFNGIFLRWGQADKLMLLIILLLFCFQSMGQQKKETIKTFEAIKKTSFSLKENVHQYNYLVEKVGEYKVIVLNPSGEIISQPVKQQHFVKDQVISVEINSKYWKTGVYKILFEKKSTIVATYQLKITSDRYKL